MSRTNGVSEWQFLNPPKCRKCGHTICPTMWACSNPQCPKNLPKNAAKKARRSRRSVA